MSTGKLQGRRALVTGAADGIGLGITRVFASEGARVFMADFDIDKARTEAATLAAKGHEAEAIPVDVSDKAQIVAMMRGIGPVDILVNNAYRGGGVERIEKKSDAAFEAALGMNLWASKWTMEAALPAMKSQRWGRIINMGSLNGVNAHIGSADYNASKEALRAYTRTAAREWAPYGICCNIICPAAWSAASRRMAALQPEMIDHINAANPMGRLGDPETDIAPVAVFLASDDCRYLTGNTLYVDGGGHINGVAWAPDLGEED
jgi:NAD(P)-dependent dehydrogenase (short-subunit alcohol dehydrogenase family)